MQGFGVLIFFLGVLDYFMAQSGVDIYYDWFGITLPDQIYVYSHWIAMGLGFTLFTLGRNRR
ncbi:MAG: hypothetical protein NTW43_03575 [Actinobacteria bacterium]|nr:hypothetical protein [Actinomycetota bacterium]